MHPDLGLGGAERLTIDVALSLQALGHFPVIYTPHQDPSRTFAEVAPPNPQIPVHVLHTPVPRHILGRFHAICAALRCAVCAFFVCCFRRPDVAIVDIVSLPVLIFALFRVPVMFYCHYPDKLLVATLKPGLKPSLGKRIYRAIVDSMEALSLRFASIVVCNSRFTASAYATAFPRLKKPAVVYPCIHVRENCVRKPTNMLLSINRYERKKSISLAIETLAVLVEREPSRNFSLVVAGGYDERLAENVTYFKELQRLVQNRGLQGKVSMLRNISEDERDHLLESAFVVLYTPSNEHFGIVPLEAMAAGVPVVAANSGGPTESVEDGVTGFLTESSADAFACAVLKINGESMGASGKSRVSRYFSREVLGREMQNLLARIVDR